jgi:Protein of unknown function (DUF2769)
MVVEDSSKNESKCICHSCPTFPRNGDPIFYCSRGKSQKAINRVTCTCPGCQVWHENDLSGLYFCDEGPAEV